VGIRVSVQIGTEEEENSLSFDIAKEGSTEGTFLGLLDTLPTHQFSCLSRRIARRASKHSPSEGEKERRTEFPWEVEATGEAQGR
jgi:hypothetical protein